MVRIKPQTIGIQRDLAGSRLDSSASRRQPPPLHAVLAHRLFLARKKKGRQPNYDPIGYLRLVHNEIEREGVKSNSK
jgi:hypothetical protein